MKVVLYARTELKQFRALAEGCQAMGHTVAWQNPRYWNPREIIKDADAVVIHGIQLHKADMRDAYQSRNVPVWIMELPRLRDEPDTHALYLNSVHWIPDRDYRKPVTHGLLKNRKEEYVLVCGQVPGDIAHGMPENQWDGWSRNTVAKAREVTGLPVMYRQHPVYKRPIPEDGFGADEVSEHGTIYEAMKGAALVVTHNSTVGWNAIDAGVPVVYTATPPNEPGWRDYASGSIERPKTVTAKERKEALARVASTQWTMAELKDGTAALRMFGETAKRKAA
jgi:hypothetical protein